jgi:hypothetical protein
MAIRWRAMLCVALGAAFTLAPATVAQADVIYREIFPNAVVPYVPLAHPGSDAGWRAFRGNTGEAMNPNTVTQGLLLSGGAGVGGSLAPINSNPANSEINRGYFYTATVSPLAPFLLITDEFTLDRDARTIDEFRWYQNNDRMATELRVAIQVEGSWFVSAQVFTNQDYPSNISPGVFGQQAFNFSTAGSAWHALNFSAGSVLSRSATTLPGDLPTGDIAAFGIYTDQKFGGRIAIDNFEVLASPVPEPSSLALVAFGTAAWMLGLAARRRGRPRDCA